jgi:cysteine desulfuration protein SufE
MNEIPDRLQEIVEDFSLCVGQEKLEYLLEFAESLEPLPERLAAKKDSMLQVHECMTPVFIEVENQDGLLTYYFDVPVESPTVRGFAAILSEGIRQVSAEEVLQIPNDFYRQMGLHQVLTGQRLNGIGAILAHMKQLASNHLPENGDQG